MTLTLYFVLVTITFSAGFLCGAAWCALFPNEEE